MSTFLPAANSPASLGLTPIDRRTKRELERVQSGGVVLAAQNMARVNAIADVTETALVAASHVSAVEGMLVSRVPHAEVRLQHIADAGCACMASVVLGMGRLTR